jgi:outer membrane protein assembly factor BamB
VASCALAGLPSVGRAETAAELVRRSGVEGGLIVHVGCGDGRFTADLRVNERYVVQGLERDPALAARARRRLAERGLAGPVTVIGWDGKALPYTDNLVNLLVVESGARVDDDEVMRVLRPEGVALIAEGRRRVKRVKPWPDDIDEWTHYLHGPDNNAVAEDTRVGPPRRMQWVSGPRLGRSHDHLSSVSAVVTARGRMFAIVDEGPLASVKADSKWMLVARDAFNGVLLWKKEVAPWEGQLRPFRSGPAELPRRLVAVGERVYATLGYGKPVVALDAATGRLLHTFAGTENAHEIIVSDGRLFVVVSAPLTDESPTTGKVIRRFPVWRGSYPEYTTRYEPRHVRAFDAESGRPIWKKADADATNIIPLTLIAGEEKVFFQNESGIVALESATGRLAWKADRPSVRQRYAWLVPTIVVKDGVVLSADRLAGKPVDTGAEDKQAVEWRVSANHKLTGGEIAAFSARDGRELWKAPCHEGFNSPADVFVIGGKVYTGILAWGKQPGITGIYDLKTGTVVETKPPDQKLYTFGFGHHRCHRNKATTKYVIQGRAGIEFIDLSRLDTATADHWVRGACQYGSLPANGLVYAPTHPCACYISAKLDGFNALSPSRDMPSGEVRERLEKGRAYGDPAAAGAGARDEWPTLRHDAARSGAAEGKLATSIRPAWETRLPGPLTAVVVAGGRVYVAQREAGTVQALKSTDGSRVWSYTTGGRVDSPPTFHGGRVYFGSADGWMYCLRAADGELAWRFRVAPDDRQIVAYGKLESAWPVPGTVLVLDGPDGPVAYAAAGRTSYVDGGVHLCGVDAVTGALRFRRRISHMDPETGNEPQKTIRGVTMPGAMPDVLSTDGKSIFMRHQRFDLEGNPLKQDVDHIFSAAGFVDGSWWHRSYLQIGRSMGGGYGGWTSAGNSRISGKALVRGPERAYGFGRKQYTITGSHLGLQSEFRLFAADLKPVQPAGGKRGKKGRKPRAKINYVWQKPSDILPRAMVLAGETLFLAGPREVEDFAAPEPRGDVFMLAISAADGAEKMRRKLKAPPVHDSFAVAGGRLFFATVDGRVVCWK